jgi:hypothetical protein
MSQPFEVVEPNEPAPRRKGVVLWLILGVFAGALVPGAIAAALAVRLVESQRAGAEANARAEAAEAQAASVQKARAELADIFKPRPNVEAPSEPKAAAEYVPLGEWCDSDFAAVRIVSAEVAKPKMRQAFTGDVVDGGQAELIIRLEIKNNSPTRKLDYYRFRFSDFDNKARATDEHKNQYPAIEHDGSAGKGSLALGEASKTMHPGDPVHVDYFCFERPVEAATELRITLGALTPEGKPFHFKLVAADWKPAKK